MIFFIFSTYADYLFEHSDYYRAITEYKRNLFLGIDSMKSMEMLGESYIKLGDYNNALYWFSRLNFISDKYRERYMYLLGITLHLDDLKIIIEDEDDKLNEIVSRFEKRSNVVYLSYIIPGSSQILQGRLRGGLFSFIWNSVSLYFCIQRFRDKEYIGAIFSLSLFLRFYDGNLKMAYEIEREKAYKRYVSEIEKYFENK